MMAKGLVYILTNPCFDGWVKIGMTSKRDINQRLKELNSPTNIPLSFRCYATYEVDNAVAVEQSIHRIIDKIDGTLHAREQLVNGKIREREFFKITPDTAFGIFKEIAKLRGDESSLKLSAPTEDESIEEEIAASKTKKSNNSFTLLKIAVGEYVSFLADDSIKAKVVNDKNQLEYNGEEYSVSALATKLLRETQNWGVASNVNGFRYFTKDGITLSDLRDIIESEE
ncbi:MAG: GIY-YIG nuclease family protein [Bacillota bacterium]